MRSDALEIFEQIVATGHEERRRRLDVLCPPGDPRREQVLLLLRHDSEATTAGLPVQVGSRIQPTAIPGFRIDAVLGRGATSVVYRAYQEVPPRPVALKVLTTHETSAAARRRFRTEVESLARFNHPGIAQVFAAGAVQSASGSGMYIAMELIDGAPVTEAGRPLTIRERVGVLARIAEAVDYAHQRGVVHRDLKPSNILLARTALGPVPKILDFGIARILDDQAAAGTRTDGGFVGTLAYAAPERFDRSSAAIADVRADVYSLGVIAYELLAGRPPIEVHGEPLGVAIDRIRSEEPPPLGRLDRALRGDLECIVAMALAKEPQCRYPSAAALADDLQRHLQHRAVAARSAGWIHRTSRWVRRHRAAAGLTVLAVIGGALAAWSWLGGVQRAQHRLLVFDAILQHALAKLEGIPGSLETRSHTLAAMLSEFPAAAADLPDDPGLLDVLARLLRQRGDVDRDLGALAPALAAREQGTRARRRLLDLTGARAVRRDLAIDIVLTGDLQHALGNLPATLALWQEAHAMFRELAATDAASVTALDDLGCSYDRLARLAHDLADDDRMAQLLAERAAVNARLAELAPGTRHTLLGLCDYHSLRGTLNETRGDARAVLAEREATLSAARDLLALDPRHRLHRRRYLEALGCTVAAMAVLGQHAACASRLDRDEVVAWQELQPDDDLERQAIARLHLERSGAAQALGDADLARRQLGAAVARLAACSPAGRAFWADAVAQFAASLARAHPQDVATRVVATAAAELNLRSALARPDDLRGGRTTLEHLADSELAPSLPAELLREVARLADAAGPKEPGLRYQAARVLAAAGARDAALACVEAELAAAGGEPGERRDCEALREELRQQ